MASFNRVIMMGNLTRDPQMSYLPSQTPVVEFGLATNRKWKDQQGQQREDVCFIDCRAYGKQAEVIAQYMAKGRTLLVEGRLQLDTWEGKDGIKRSKHRVFVENFQFVGQGPGQGGPGGPGGAPAGQGAQGGYNQGGYNQGGYNRPPARQAPQAQQPPQEMSPDEMPPQSYDEPAPPQGEDIPF